MTLNLRGLMVATVTPFHEGGATLDLDWIPDHLRFLDTMDVTAVLTLGSNGEGPSVALAERRAVVEQVVRHKGRMGVVAGATLPSLPDTVQAANDALDAGADAVALLPPYYYPDVDTDGLLDFFSTVIASLPPQGKVLLYNYPATTGIDLSDAVVGGLLELYGEQILGLKHTSSDVERARRYVALSPPEQFAVLAGSDSHHAALYAAGCVGGVTGLGNAAPQLLRTILAVHQSGGDASRAQRHCNQFKAVLAPYPALGAIKTLIHKTTGLPQTFTRPPHRDLTPAERAALERDLAAYLLAQDR